MNSTPQQLHIPVLLEEVLAVLNPQSGESYLDLTAGMGGHARKVIERIGDAKLATLCDRDSFAISQLKDIEKQGATLIHQDYEHAVTDLKASGARGDMILLDLGVSSPQLDRGERGFSFSHDGPLDMRMDNRQELTAATIVNTYPEKELARIFSEYGEIGRHQSEELAREICYQRKRQRFDSTQDLAEVVRIEVGRLDHGKYHHVHPATQVFQALRIAVNDELGQLERTLPQLDDILNSGGRLAIITFHSLEDRIVKHYLKENSGSLDLPYTLIMKKPLAGNVNDYNPRARRAKLRAACKK